MRDGIGLKAGALLVREWNGKLERVMVLDKGFAWNGKTYGSLSQIAKAMTGTSWNGHRFFGLRRRRARACRAPDATASVSQAKQKAVADRRASHGRGYARTSRHRGSHSRVAAGRGRAMKREDRKPSLRCAIYTRVSTEQGLEQEFNSLDNQREASEAYIKSQAHEGWRLIRDRYDDGGFSGGSMERPAL